VSQFVASSARVAILRSAQIFVVPSGARLDFHWRIYAQRKAPISAVLRARRSVVSTNDDARPLVAKPRCRYRLLSRSMRWIDGETENNSQFGSSETRNSIGVTAAIFASRAD